MTHNKCHNSHWNTSSGIVVCSQLHCRPGLSVFLFQNRSETTLLSPLVINKNPIQPSICSFLLFIVIGTTCVNNVFNPNDGDKLLTILFLRVHITRPPASPLYLINSFKKYGVFVVVGLYVMCSIVRFIGDCLSI